ncbi:YkvA family protein [Tsuneonella amylolytica]|uniref:YkvA family protein n=1 Tax=Tsuneonella amylolytica TaxID=2338327 RepID=UPI001F257384|nr:YkvA family protein [Tsuneonella amylolytica]
MKDRAKALKREALTLWVAARDPRTPLAAKMLAGAVAAYAFSPVDLIPDFIPVLGLLDDLLIVPLGVWAVLKLIPPPLVAAYCAEAAALAERPTSRTAAVVVVAVWAIALAGAAWLITR